MVSKQFLQETQNPDTRPAKSLLLIPCSILIDILPLQYLSGPQARLNERDVRSGRKLQVLQCAAINILVDIEL